MIIQGKIANIRLTKDSDWLAETGWCEPFREFFNADYKITNWGRRFNVEIWKQSSIPNLVRVILRTDITHWMSTFLYRKREKLKLLLPIRIEKLGKSTVPVPRVVLCSPMDAFNGLTMLKKNLKILLRVLSGRRVQWQFLSRRSKHFDSTS